MPICRPSSRTYVGSTRSSIAPRASRALGRARDHRRVRGSVRRLGEAGRRHSTCPAVADRREDTEVQAGSLLGLCEEPGAGSTDARAVGERLRSVRGSPLQVGEGASRRCCSRSVRWALSPRSPRAVAGVGRGREPGGAGVRPRLHRSWSRDRSGSCRM